MTGCVHILGVLSARSIFNERLISCVRTREKWPFHHFLTLVIDKCSTVERNKLSDHFNCILVVRIDSTTCDRNMKENYFGVQNRVERFKGDGLLNAIMDGLALLHLHEYIFFAINKIWLTNQSSSSVIPNIMSL